ncbi:complexed with cef1p [Dipsacomyces acuminosporus]|nr:complexed with cef1p [Dipsacomyces acuminosporus]
MTTAARPTFDPAKGKATIDISHQLSAKNLPSHTKLKTRKPGQGGEQEYTIEDLKAELREAERRHFESKRLDHDGEGTGASTRDLESEKMNYIELAQQLDAESDESDGDTHSNGSSSDSEGEEGGGGGSGSDSDSDSDEDSEDETAMLMRELEKIKRERAEEKAREEKEAMEQRLVDEEASSSFLGENPLLKKRDFAVKRRWDDDVVFKNQARDEDDKPKKRFINDMLRSDFHRKFMRKYVH